MNKLRIVSKGGVIRLALLALMAAALLAGAGIWNGKDASANHPVLVEGEQDFDGDGLIGVDEDNDSATDQVFGTITAALGMANAGANQNGRVLVVTTGRFLGAATITAANGNVQLEAVPGVDAIIEAVRAGDPGNGTRQQRTGIDVNSAATRIVTIRNVTSRNWTDGINIMGASRVILENCRFDNNTNFGIHVVGSAKVTINNCSVTGSGFRTGANVDNTAKPGIGIGFEGTSSGTVAFTMVSGSVAAGISNMTSNKAAVGLLSINVFDNNPNLNNIKEPKGSIPGVRGN